MNEKAPSALVISGNASIASPMFHLAKESGYEVHASHRRAFNRDPKCSWVEWHSLDIVSQASVDDFINEIGDTSFTKIFFFSGRTSHSDWQSTSLPDIQDVFNANVIGISYLLTRLLPLFSDSTSVGLMSSVSGSFGSFDVNYACSKAALEALASNVSKKLLPTQSIFCLAPLTISESSMYLEMDSETRARHVKRANFNLLSSFEVCNSFWNISNLPPAETSGRTFQLPDLTI